MLPNLMKVVEISEAGGPEVLQVNERALPQLEAGEVLIKVVAAGVNRPDVFQRMGIYPPPDGASDLPGLEVSGVIVDGDFGGNSFHIGDRVCALTPGGGYAEYCKAPASNCLPLPKGVDFIGAASLPETYFTVWSNVFDIAHLETGDSLLVHGGASGIGTSAIQIATALGHKVYVTVGSDERVIAIEALGATKGINYKTQDFVEEILKLTDGNGVDVVLDMVSGEYLNRDIKCAAIDGRIVVIAQLGGSRAEINSGLLMRKRVTLTGSTLRPRSVEYKAKIAKELKERVWPLIENGMIKPVIDRVFDFQDASKAHEYMESGNHIGKIVLKISDEIA